MDNLTVEGQFRLRGLEVTRLDTFIDAAFAFVLTLLIISYEELPSDYTELIIAVKRIPAFAFSFALLMMFWGRHRSWSRRYGLENSRTIPLSLALIFVVLVYVYPLRIILEAMFFDLSNGYLPSGFQIQAIDELRRIFVFYSVGFFAMSLILNQLYGSAMRSSSSLGLNQSELRNTRLSMQSWAVAASFAPLSVLLALVVSDAWIALAG